MWKEARDKYVQNNEEFFMILPDHEDFTQAFNLGFKAGWQSKESERKSIDGLCNYVRELLEDDPSGFRDAEVALALEPFISKTKNSPDALVKEAIYLVERMDITALNKSALNHLNEAAACLRAQRESRASR